MTKQDRIDNIMKLLTTWNESVTKWCLSELEAVMQRVEVELEQMGKRPKPIEISEEILALQWAPARQGMHEAMSDFLGSPIDEMSKVLMVPTGVGQFCSRVMPSDWVLYRGGEFFVLSDVEFGKVRPLLEWACREDMGETA